MEGERKAGSRAEARLLFHRGRGINRGCGAEPQVESRADPLVRWSRGEAPEAENFSVVGWPKEMENLLQFSYFCDLFIIQQMLW